MTVLFPLLLQYGDWGLWLLRLAVGVIFIVHGWPKAKKPAGMASGMGVSPAAVRTLGLVESLSGLALIAGLWTQLAALLLMCVMLGAGYMKMNKWHVPFTAMDKTGWEFDMLLLAANLAILLTGGGTIGLF